MSIGWNAFVERFMQAILQDTLIVFGREHLDHLNQEYLAYYHQDPVARALLRSLYKPVQS